MMHFMALFITAAVLVMFLGSKQQRSLDRYSLASALLLSSLALSSAFLLKGTIFFPASALAFALLLLVHRSIVSFAQHVELPQSAPECSPFRPRDACTHETWIVAAVTAGLVSLLRL
jgi:hypothetical protein